jgi:hypothetical protein
LEILNGQHRLERAPDFWAALFTSEIVQRGAQ